MTTSDSVGLCYSGTMEPIQIGHVVLIDLHIGVIKMVMHAKSVEAKNYGCYETGGLLLEMKEFGLVVEPFGVLSRVEKADKDTTTEGR